MNPRLATSISAAPLFKSDFFMKSSHLSPRQPKKLSQCWLKVRRLHLLLKRLVGTDRGRHCEADDLSGSEIHTSRYDVIFCKNEPLIPPAEVYPAPVRFSCSMRPDLVTVRRAARGTQAQRLDRGAICYPDTGAASLTFTVK